MQPLTAVQGIHHITAITGSASANVTFMEQVLGLRLVKQTVNFDDPFTYHLYYGDACGKPGTIVTFFPWEKAPAGSPGAGMISALALAIPSHALRHWRLHLSVHGIQVQEHRRFGEVVLQFTDAEGLGYELVACEMDQDQSADRTAITGLHSVTATAASLHRTHELLTDTLGMVYVGKEESRRRYALQTAEGRKQFYDLLIRAEPPAGTQGRGTVHHIAFRCSSDAEQKLWQERLLAQGHAVSPVRDRKYFRSIYFREPNGVLFEIATDPPGFTVDEELAALGSQLQLPDEYERMRSEIAGQLPELRPLEYIHRYVASEGFDHPTIVAFHGTGGDEHDLLHLACSIAPGAAIISPRGQLVEQGMNRFFRRLSAAVFDEEDIRKRSAELDSFIRQAAAHYSRDSGRLIALGYSNGANMAAALLLLYADLFAGAVLVRPMLPIADPPPANLTGKPLLILKGAEDTVIPAESTSRLIDVLNRAGARLKVVEVAAGHEISQTDIDTARKWLAEIGTCAPASANR